jgi:hypothetical protein
MNEIQKIEFEWIPKSEKGDGRLTFIETGISRMIHASTQR